MAPPVQTPPSTGSGSHVLNPTAMVLVGLAAVGLIVAVRGTQDNVLSAIAGHQVGGSTTSSSGSGKSAEQIIGGITQKEWSQIEQLQKDGMTAAQWQAGVKAAEGLGNAGYPSNLTSQEIAELRSLGQENPNLGSVPWSDIEALGKAYPNGYQGPGGSGWTPAEIRKALQQDGLR